MGRSSAANTEVAIKGRWSRIAAAVGLVAVSIPASAQAAIEIGRADGNGTSVGCTSGVTFVQSNTGATTPSYAVPAGGGVIVAWKVEATTLDETVKLKVFRPTPLTNMFTVVGESDTFGLPGPGIQQFPAQIPVAAGDRIGFATKTTQFTGCALGTADPANIRRAAVGDPPVGSTITTLAPPSMNSTLNIAATVEPDADGDGFGDETQDGCPSEASVQEPPCDRIAPETTITDGPKNKTRKQAATFEFSGTDARAVAGFQCSLDGGAFSACTSPHTVKVKKGKHRFQVRAVDQAGNVGTPASDDWKVKKKKK